MTNKEHETPLSFSASEEPSPIEMVYDQVTDLLDEWGTSWQEDPEGSPLRRIIYEEKLPDLVDCVSVMLIFREDLLNIQTRYQRAVPESAVPEILKYMNELNSHLEYGNFVLIDDHVTFRTHFSYDDETTVSFRTLADLIQKGTDAFYDYGDGFVRIMKGESDSSAESINALNIYLLSTVKDYVEDEDLEEYDIHNILQKEWLPVLFYNLEYTKNLLNALEKTGSYFLEGALRGACHEQDIEVTETRYDISKSVSDDGVHHLRIILPEPQENDLCHEIHLLYTEDLSLRQYFMVVRDDTVNRELIASLLPDPDDLEYYGEASSDPAVTASAIEDLFCKESGV